MELSFYPYLSMFFLDNNKNIKNLKTISHYDILIKLKNTPLDKNQELYAFGILIVLLDGSKFRMPIFFKKIDSLKYEVVIYNLNILCDYNQNQMSDIIKKMFRNNNIEKESEIKIQIFNISEIFTKFLDKNELNHITLKSINVRNVDFKKLMFDAYLQFDVSQLKFEKLNSVAIHIKFKNLHDLKNSFSLILTSLTDLCELFKSISKFKNQIDINNCDSSKLISSNYKEYVLVNGTICKNFNTFIKSFNKKFIEKYQNINFDSDSDYLKFKEIITNTKYNNYKNAATFVIKGIKFKIEVGTLIRLPIFLNTKNKNELTYTWLKHNNKLEEFYSKTNLIKIQNL